LVELRYNKAWLGLAWSTKLFALVQRSSTQGGLGRRDQGWAVLYPTRLGRPSVQHCRSVRHIHRKLRGTQGSRACNVQQGAECGWVVRAAQHSAQHAAAASERVAGHTAAVPQWSATTRHRRMIQVWPVLRTCRPPAECSVQGWGGGWSRSRSRSRLSCAISWHCQAQRKVAPCGVHWMQDDGCRTCDTSTTPRKSYIHHPACSAPHTMLPPILRGK
jgi:hypothetical protein